MSRTIRTDFARVGTLLAAICLLLVGTLLTAPPASAGAKGSSGLLDVTCTPPSSAVSSYSPPLSNTPQTSQSTIFYQFGPCLSLSQPGITSGSSVVTNPPPGNGPAWTCSPAEA
jgi:hypothetical protein